MTNEMLQKARACQSVDELLALARENGIDLSAEEAAARYAALKDRGELSDDELNSVSGGGCGDDGSSSDSGGSTTPRREKQAFTGYGLARNCPVCGYDCWQFRHAVQGTGDNKYRCLICYETAGHNIAVDVPFDAPRSNVTVYV